jgi:arylsulfatase A-like enzyme
MNSLTKLFRVALAVTLITCTGVTSAIAANEKPNVVFILFDNVGFGDLGPYGGGERRGAPTPHIDRLAREGLTLTQHLVEPACTPSRAALMTGQYSIRNGLSLVIVPGTDSSLSASAPTMSQMFKSQGYATAIFGKWHLGKEPQALPMAHGFDEYYGIQPDVSWDSATYATTIEMTKSFDAPESELIKKGPYIIEAEPGGGIKKVKPYTMQVRTEIDGELIAKGIDFMKRQSAANKPFFLYLPISVGHIPNLPSEQFKGKSRIGNYGDKLMEGDHHVGQIMNSLKELGVDDNTILVLASDNGPEGMTAREWGNNASPDAGNSGPYRGELGGATDGALRTAGIIRWPGHIKAGSTSNAMFSIMDFYPTFASIVGAEMPADKPIDGVSQVDLLLGKSVSGNRDSLLSFIGSDLVAARWKQWHFYFTDMRPTGQGTQRLDGFASTNSALAGYPKVYNIEMDPYEVLNVAGPYSWTIGPGLKVVEEYLESLKQYPNPPAANMTKF